MFRLIAIAFTASFVIATVDDTLTAERQNIMGRTSDHLGDTDELGLELMKGAATLVRGVAFD